MLENTEGAIKNGQLATYGTQDEEKQSTNTIQYVMDTTIRKQIQMTYMTYLRHNLQLVKDGDEPFRIGKYHEDQRIFVRK
jgi:hypothetical protein